MNIFPENVSTYGEAIDSLSALITVFVAIGFFIAMGILLYSIVKFRKKEGVKASYFTGESWAQLKWIFIPLIVVLGMDFVIDIRTVPVWNLIKQFRPTADVSVRVTGQQFSWVFTYPDEKGDFDGDNAFQSMGDMHVPIGKNIVFDLEAKDVLHSFSIPSLRLKQDAVPGRKIKGWFNATKIGAYDIACAQICGGGHTNMQGRIIVESEEDFAKWLSQKGKTADASATGADPVARGMELSKTKTCTACHSLDGTRLVGPSYKALFGKKETVITDGKEHEVLVDEAYLRKSIQNPAADVVKGYQPTMPNLNLKDEEISDIIEYLKTVK